MNSLAECKNKKFAFSASHISSGRLLINWGALLGDSLRAKYQSSLLWGSLLKARTFRLEVNLH